MKTVLFVCIKNSCRSQMAEGLANAMTDSSMKCYSAGSKPSGLVNQKAIEVMHEIGIDISKAKSKTIDQLPIDQFDYIVTMGCGDTCPVILGNRHIEWQIDDPEGKDINAFRNVRDNIKEKIITLNADIKNNK